MLRRLVVVLTLALALCLATPAADAGPRGPQATSAGADCNLPESDADALVILNYYYPNRYVWEDTDLTVACDDGPRTVRRTNQLPIRNLKANRPA